MSDWHELGHGVRATFVISGDPDGEYTTIGVMHEHPAADGSDGIMGAGVCAGVMLLDVAENAGRPTWQITSGSTASFEGLSLTPSSLCRACGHHGYIINGEWIGV